MLRASTTGRRRGTLISVADRVPTHRRLGQSIAPLYRNHHVNQLFPRRFGELKPVISSPTISLACTKNSSRMPGATDVGRWLPCPSQSVRIPLTHHQGSPLIHPTRSLVISPVKTFSLTCLVLEGWAVVKG